MHGLAVYAKEGLPFARDLPLENSADSYLCFRLALLHSVSYFFFLYRSPSSSLCTVFDSVSSNIDEVLSINPSANVFVFGDFNVHHKDWLTYCGGTDRPGELCYNDFTQIVNFPTRIPDCDSHSPALLDLFLSSDASICSTMAFPPLGNSDHVFVSVSIDFPLHAKLFAKNFSKNSNLDDSGISLPVFPSRTNLKLHNISITPKMVKKVIMNLDSSESSGPDCIPVVVLKNCEPELSYILAKLFNKCLKESCFPDCWKVSSVVPVFRNVGERSTAKNYRPVSLLSVVSKVFEKLVNNRIVDHLEKCGLFSDFHYGFRSSRSTADLLTVVSDRIARAFNRSGATRAVALDISKALTEFGMLVFFTNLSLMEFQVRYLALFLLFLVIGGFGLFWMGNLHKNIQLMLVFLKGLFLVLHFSYYTLMTFLIMLSVILVSMLMILLSTLNVIRHLICGNN